MMRSLRKVKMAGMAHPTVWLWFLACALFLGCDKQEGASVGQIEYQIEKKYDNDAIDFTLKIEKPQLASSDTLRIQLQAIADENIDVTLPSVARQLGEYDFSIIESQTTGPKLLDDNRILYRDTYLLEPVLPGTRELPALEITYKIDGKSQPLTTDPIAIEVISPFDSDSIETQQLADIKPLVKVRFKHQNLWLWISIATAVVLAITIILIRRYRQTNKRVRRLFKPAHELALARLRELEQRDLIEQGLIKLFYETISHILREYIEDRFHLQAPDRTTEEFLQEAHASNALNDTHTEKLKNVLVHCDQVKFARYHPDMNEIHHSITLVKDFIESTIDQQCRIDVTETPSVLEVAQS